MTSWVQTSKVTTMSAKPSAVTDLFKTVEPLFGRTLKDGDLEALLKDLEKWPVPPFGDEDFVIFQGDKTLGYDLVFDDAETVKIPEVTEKTPRTHLLVGCFFFNEGFDGNQAFPGHLPWGIAWSDNAASLVSKFGPPMNEIMNKKTGLLNSHRWKSGRILLTARYIGGGTSLRQIYVGIK